MGIHKLKVKYFKINQALFRKARSPLLSHGPDHHLRVCENALWIANRVKCPVDLEVLVIASMLHDLAAYYPEKTGEKYHDFDHKLAAKVLSKEKLPKEKFSKVLDCIRLHGSATKYKKTDEAVEITILRDADKLEAFGPLGVARIVQVRTLKGDDLQQIVHDFYAQGHLKRKFDSITIPFAKKLARPQYEYSLRFFKELNQILKR